MFFCQAEQRSRWAWTISEQDRMRSRIPSDCYKIFGQKWQAHDDHWVLCCLRTSKFAISYVSGFSFSKEPLGMDLSFRVPPVKLTLLTLGRLSNSYFYLFILVLDSCGVKLSSDGERPCQGKQLSFSQLSYNFKPVKQEQYSIFNNFLFWHQERIMAMARFYRDILHA